MASEIYHLDITLTGVALNLAAVLDSTAAYRTQRDKLPGIVQASYGTVPGKGVGGGYTVRMLSIQADPSNANRALVGDAALSATSWGFYIPKPTTNVPEPPLVLDGANVQLTLGSVWLLGDANDVLHLTVMPY